IRDQYMNASNYKALAMSLTALAFVTGKPDQETADRAAIADCERTAGAMPKNPSPADQADHTCELYASGTVVVTHRESVPMPPKPWTNASVERPFALNEFPMIQPKLGNVPQYPPDARSKAIAMAPSGFWYIIHSQESAEEATRRILERCGYLEQVACVVIAVDDRFVTAVPTSARPVGLYRPDAFFSGRSDQRAELARRLARATEGWSAVALGAGGHLGIATGAASERAAVDSALNDCAAHDRNCRLAVIGPFLVEPDPGKSAASSPPPPPAAAPAPSQPAPTPAAAEALKLDPERVPLVTLHDKQRIRDSYMPAPDYKAVAMSLLQMAFVTG